MKPMAVLAILLVRPNWTPLNSITTNFENAC